MGAAHNKVVLHVRCRFTAPTALLKGMTHLYRPQTYVGNYSAPSR